jgi:hypothetical protein
MNKPEFQNIHVHDMLTLCYSRHCSYMTCHTQCLYDLLNYASALWS